VGGGAPDKWGPGTAVYKGASTCGGYFSLNQGTLALGNDGALSNVRLLVGDSTGANFVTIQSADSTAHMLANKLVFNALNFSFGAGGNLTFSDYIDVGANSGAPTAISVSNSITTFSGVLTNTGGLTKTGPGTLVLSGTSANTYGSAVANGYTTLNAGTLKLAKSTGVAAVPNGTLVLNSGGTLALGASDQIADTVTLTLNGGVFQSAGFNEQLGTLKLTANSVLDLGAGASVLKFAASSGVAWTGGVLLTISNWNGSIGGGGSEQLVFGSSSSGLTSTQVSQIRFVNPPGFPAGSYAAKLLASGEMVPITVAPGINVQPPASRIAVAGDTVSLGVTATGTPAPGYQWLFNGIGLPGATAATAFLPSVTVTQSGSYRVAVTNVAGAVTSTPTVLSVYLSAAPTFSNGVSLINGRFQLTLGGVPGYSYAIQTSTNLTDWLPLITNTAPFPFTDSISPFFPWRFYRGEYVP